MVFHGTFLFRAVSGEFALPHRTPLAAETFFRGEKAAADAKVSRGAFGGQHFRTSASEGIAQQRAQNSPYCS